MHYVDEFLTGLISWLPAAVTIVLVVLVIFIIQRILYKQLAGSPGKRFRVQFTVLLLSFVGLLIVVLSLPINDSTKGQLLSLFGLLFSAAIALSATTFVGNIMAGLMLRSVRNFKGGDYVRVGDYFGRVSERGLFHVEIQTEHRDLITLPNLYLVTHPVTVVRSSGTMVWAEVSLGYDIPHGRIRAKLCEAAERAGLEEAFAQVIELGDFSVTYRVSGLLTDTRNLISGRSRLRECMLDLLHGDGIEIVSPTFMNQRPLTADRSFIPPLTRATDAPKSGSPESVMFDKAAQAETVEKLRERREQLAAELEKLKEERGTATGGYREEIDNRIEALKLSVESLAETIEERLKENES